MWVKRDIKSLRIRNGQHSVSIRRPLQSDFVTQMFVNGVEVINYKLENISLDIQSKFQQFKSVFLVRHQLKL